MTRLFPATTSKRTAPGSVLPAFGCACLLALLIGTATFVKHRNQTFVDQELTRARAATQAVARGDTLSNALAQAVVVASPSPKEYPFLAVRRTREGRRLGGSHAQPYDKILFDAAGRAERNGAFAELLDDGARSVSAQPTENGIAIVVFETTASPAGFPWLVLFGLLMIGAAMAVAGSLLGPASRFVGLFAGSSAFAIPIAVWGGPLPAAACVFVAAACAVFDRRGGFAHLADALRSNRSAYAFAAPTAIAMGILVIAPFLIGLALGFYDHHHGQWTFVGWDNFREILTGGGRPLSDPLNFWFTLGVTVAWTVCNVFFHVALGVVAALLLNKTWLRGRGVFRVLLILPWAIPNYITALVWHGMFQGEYGAINGLLAFFGLDSVSWFSEFSTAFFANVCTNSWLGFPFMMVVALGALQTIPPNLYEAADVDGASSWQKLRHITLPHLWPAMMPAMVLGTIWTFNMFNVIYLVSDGNPGGATDILVTEAYRWAFERGERYGLAAAYATLIFGILLLWAVFGTKLLSKEKSS